VRAVLEQDSPRALARLACVEMLIMFGTLGSAAALSHTAPPAAGAERPSTVDVLIGYPLEGKPTLTTMLFD
jgi:hypothetical protein